MGSAALIRAEIALTARSTAILADVVTAIKTLAQRYCFASGAFKTFLQAAGSAAIVIPGLGLEGFSGGFGGAGWMIESLNQ